MKKAIFYTRVSAVDQNEARQVANIDLNKYEVYSDKISGSVAFEERPQGAKVIELVKSNAVNEVMVHSIDRLGRNTIDVLSTIQFMTDNGVNVISAKEGLSTLNPDGTKNMTASLVINILASVAEMERERIRERQKEGIAIAKIEGRYKEHGRPKGTGKSADDLLKEYKHVRKELTNGVSLRRTAKLCSVSLSTVQKVQKVMKSKGLI